MQGKRTFYLLMDVFKRFLAALPFYCHRSYTLQFILNLLYFVAGLSRILKVTYFLLVILVARKAIAAHYANRF